MTCSSSTFSDVAISCFTSSGVVYETSSGIILFVGTYSYNKTPKTKIIAKHNNNIIIISLITFLAIFYLPFLRYKFYIFIVLYLLC